MKTKTSNESGFTLMEILIASGILTMLLSALFLTFRSTGDSFSSGTWRVHNQKQLQAFLTQLRTLLEKANYAQVIQGDGNISSSPLPIFIGSDWYNKSGRCIGVNKPVFFFSVTEPFVQAQPSLGRTTDTRGKWTGITVYCKDKKLYLKRTSDWDDLSVPNTAPNEIHPSTTYFDYGRTGVDFTQMIEDVASMAITISKAPEGVNATGTTILIAVTQARFVNSKITDTVVKEEIHATLLERTHDIRQM